MFIGFNTAVLLVLIPRYARVNEHKISVEQAIKSFQHDGYTLVDYPDNLRDLKMKEFCVDKHLYDMLVFHQKTDFHAHPLYLSGNIILQVSLPL